MATSLPPRLLDDKSGWTIADPQRVRRRAWWSLGVLGVAFLSLLVRLWYLQVVKGEEMLVAAQHNRLKSVPVPAPRGLILDRRGFSPQGVVLATSRSYHSVSVVPAALPSARREPEERARILGTLSFLLKTTTAEIEARLHEARERGGKLYDPVSIAESVDLETITRVEENKPRLNLHETAVLVTDDIRRAYPNGTLAAHVLGYTGIVTQEDMERSREEAVEDPNARQLGLIDVIGRNGIERKYDRELSGISGSMEYEVDARLRPVNYHGSTKEKPGHTIILTLDAKLQRAAEAALSAAHNSGAVAAIDPRNGEVLVLASRPTFDPNLFSLPRKKFRPAYLSLVQHRKHPLINRAVTSRFPPGSTFKMVTAAAGLQHGSLYPGIVRHCGGGYHLGHAHFGCWKTHGSVDLIGALAGSCDVYFYQVGLKLGDPESSGPEYLAKIARQFGLGSKTGIDLPTDEDGLIPDPAWRRRINAHNADLAHWYPGNTLNMSIGQGDVLATPLQMAMVTAAVANGGTLWQPHLLKAVLDEKKESIRQGQSESRPVGVKREYLNIVRAGMRAVITKGTASFVFKDMQHVAIAGKTGSAEDANHALPHAWFVCFAPYNNPRIAIACVIENAGHGSENAAPVCKKILEAMFPAPKTSTDERMARR